MSISIKKDIRVRELPNLGIKKGANYVITTNNINYATHGIHKYPAKFIPHIPRWAINEYLSNKTNKLILDPFCGSGTTLLEAAISGHRAVGIDIDPLSRLISKVKLTPIDPNLLSRVYHDIEKSVSRKKMGRFSPVTSNLYHWFSKKNAKDLSILRDVIDTYKDQKDIYDFLIITLSSIIRKASNADDQSQKTYVSHTHIKSPPSVFPIFFKAFKNYIKQMQELQTAYKGSDHKFKLPNELDATNLHTLIEKNSIDLAITSPPYIKAIDYIYNQMVELFWIGDLFGLDTQKKQNSYKRKYIGTKAISKDQYKNIPTTNYKVIDQLIEKITPDNRKHAFIVADYFKKMEQNLKSVRRTLKHKSHYVVVVGNCNVSGFDIDVTNYLIQIAQKNGFKLHNLFSYTIRNRFMRFSRNGKGGLITHDWVIDLVKD